MDEEETCTAVKLPEPSEQSTSFFCARDFRASGAVVTCWTVLDAPSPTAPSKHAILLLPREVVCSRLGSVDVAVWSQETSKTEPECAPR